MGWLKAKAKWSAYIHNEGKWQPLGLSDLGDEEAAARAFDKTARHFSYLTLSLSPPSA
jgi:hypothetical protein